MRAFDVGLQYPVAGRFAAPSQCMPVSANLLHHAIEIFLKGCLVKRVGFSGIPRGKNGHDLNALWCKFREYFQNESLERFGSVVAKLHDFEKIRYPENLISGGGLLGIGFPSGARHMQLEGPKVPEYQIAVEDVDALVHALFRAGNVNPKFYGWLFDQKHAQTYFNYRNASPLIPEEP
ncbi:MAG TPA: hypothetical protein VNO43_03620 [Candidatus Eisenbacteria bacterium]|nr:hypothetical protein [Candidatus Eisenbacteria bacterium]